MVQQLGLLALTAEGLGSIPNWGTKIPQAACKLHSTTKKKKKKKKKHPEIPKIPVSEPYPHAKSLQSCPTLCKPYEPPRLLCQWDCPAKNTGVGCHFLLQGNLPNPGIEPMSLVSPALAGRFFTTSATWDSLPTETHLTGPSQG